MTVLIESEEAIDKMAAMLKHYLREGKRIYSSNAFGKIALKAPTEKKPYYIIESEIAFAQGSIKKGNLWYLHPTLIVIEDK